MMTTALLLTIGSALALWMAWRKPTPVPEGVEWPTWPEWAVQTFGVALMSAAFLRPFATWMVST